ncbi:acyltransferase [Niastella caeni]|uniref:Acyltransferase n=1 Tax=Niastella caeni TaxID=2569763 RepID=A0A4S8I1D1_9BACT|nr:acyltransferase [Niastella caeni]THU39492.1 acyltransferase [Niastella caeni]
MKLNSIQFLRAVAALLVVYEHSMDMQMKYNTSWQQNFYHLNNFGCIGVDLFFVISGFIIMYIANNLRGPDKGWPFLEKRFYRINPVYYIASLFYFAILLIQSWVFKGDTYSSLIKMIGSFFNTLLIVPVSGDIQVFKPLLSVGWTLCFEWLFYILFFSLIICNAKNKIILLPVFILLLVIIGMLLNTDDLRLQFITNPIILEFVLGIIVCQLYICSQKIPVIIGIICLIIGLTSYGLLIRFGFGGVWYYLNTINGTQSLDRFLLWGIPSSSLVAGCVILEKNAYLTRLFNNKWIMLLGDASYSIYLVHLIVLTLFTILYKQVGVFLPADAMIWLQVIIAVAIALVFYKLVEKPIMKRLYQKTNNITAKEKSIIVIPEPPLASITNRESMNIK